jgi:hypothetical protein
MGASGQVRARYGDSFDTTPCLARSGRSRSRTSAGAFASIASSTSSTSESPRPGGHGPGSSVCGEEAEQASKPRLPLVL